MTTVRSKNFDSSLAMNPDAKKVIDEYIQDDFAKDYDIEKSREIWKRQSERFRDFWNSRLMESGREPTETEMIPIIRILDKQGKITNEDERQIEGSAFAGVFQTIWYEVLRGIQSHKPIKAVVDRILKANTDEEQGKLLDELKEENTSVRWLTGANGTVINDFIFAFAPQKNISVLSLSDRYRIIEFFGLGEASDLERMTWGSRIFVSRNKILSLIQQLHLKTDGRGLCKLLYSDRIKTLWKQAIVVPDEGKRHEIGLQDLPKHGHVVGDLINFRDMTFGPTEENGVIFLFSKITGDLGMKIHSIQKDFPDAEVLKYAKNGRGYRLFIEFEFLSSHFPAHNHLEKMREGTPCDMIVCWEHDWKECPRNVRVLELKKLIKNLPDETPQPF